MKTKRQAAKLSTAEFLSRTPVFSLDEMARDLGLRANRDAALQRVKYQIGRGRVKIALRGVYATVPPGISPDRFRPDRFLAVAAVRPDALFSHHAALELQGVAHSDWNVCTVTTKRRGAPVSLDGVQIRFVQPPAALETPKERSLGTTQVERLGRALRVTGPERTLVDGFRQPGLVGGLRELIESAAGFGTLDLELLRRLLVAYERKSLWAAVGWFLERYRRSFFVSEEYLDMLQRHRPASPHHLPRGKRRGGTFVRRWNLVLPEAVTVLRSPAGG